VSDAILVLNAGSSSLKFSAFAVEDNGRLLAHGQVDGIGNVSRFVLHDGVGTLIEDRALADDETLDHERALDLLMQQLRRWLGGQRIAAVGHRVVHGGTKFTSPVVVTTNVLAELERLVPLAPLHQPHNLSPIRRLMQSMPTVPQVACFDTAFHRTQPEVAQRYALPRHWYDAGILRYGFHGLSYEYIASILPGVDPRAATGRTIIAHLGNGASLCAVQNGRSIATTMGFTPTDGLMMGTRCGQLDPGVLLYLLTYQKMDAAALEHLIDRESGLLGVSGLSSDMRILLASQEPAAREAIDLFVYRIGREIGSMAAALGGLDAIVFTGGIGEHAAAIRSQVCRDAAWLGVSLDDNANESNERCISDAESRVTAWILPTNEELMTAHHTRRILKLKETSP